MAETTSELFFKAILAGNVCAVVSAFLNPLDVTKIRMQNQSSTSSGLKYKGMLSGATCILKEEGLAGWAKGLNASMVREVTYSSVRMGAYEPIRAMLTSLSQDQNAVRSTEFSSNNAVTNQQTPTSSPVVKFTAALISGAVGSAIANPLDIVKTRFQALMPGEKLPYNSLYGAFSEIHRNGGMRGLYKGWVVTSSRAAILTSAQLGSYDTIKNNLLIEVFGFQEGFFLHLTASMASGLITTTAANPGMLKPSKNTILYYHTLKYTYQIICFYYF
jgi:Mitochondrial carrier protein